LLVLGGLRVSACGGASKGAGLEEAELAADEGDGGDGGGFDAEDAGAEVGEGEAGVAEAGAVAWGPAALGADGEDDGGSGRRLGEGGGGLVVVEGEAGGVRRERGERGLEGVAEGDGGEAGGEGLLGAGDEVATPLAGGPELAAAVVRIALAGVDEVDRRDAEGGGVLEDAAGGLGPRETDDEADRVERGRWVVAPLEGEGEGGGCAFLGRVDGEEGGGASGAVDEAGVEGVAGGAAENLEEVDGAGVVGGKGASDLGGFEEDEVQGEAPWRLGRRGQSGWRTAWVWVTRPTARPSASSRWVSRTSEVRPLWTVRETASRWPPATGRRKWIENCMVPASSPRTSRLARTTPAASARDMMAPPWRVPLKRVRASVKGMRTRTSSGVASMTSKANCSP
jgi:hypothetical protein